MSSLLVQVAFYGLAAAVAAPIAAVLCAMILGKSARPITSALVFVAGAAFLDIVATIVFYVVLGNSFSEDGVAGAAVDIGLGVIFGVMGVMAIFSTETPERGQARQARADRVATAKLATMFSAGILVQIINIDALAVYLSGLKEVVIADVSTVQAAVATLVCLLLMLLPYYGPTVVYIVAPGRAGPLLRRMTDWMLANSRRLEIVVGLAFGVMFLAKGIAAI